MWLVHLSLPAGDGNPGLHSIHKRKHKKHKKHKRKHHGVPEAPEPEPVMVPRPPPQLRLKIKLGGQTLGTKRWEMWRSEVGGQIDSTVWSRQTESLIHFLRHSCLLSKCPHLHRAPRRSSASLSVDDHSQWHRQWWWGRWWWWRWRRALCASGTVSGLAGWVLDTACICCD